MGLMGDGMVLVSIGHNITVTFVADYILEVDKYAEKCYSVFYCLGSVFAFMLFVLNIRHLYLAST